MGRTVPLLVAAACLLALCIGRGHAWGPLSHMSFGCLAEHGDASTVADCIANNATFAVGCDLPDAFGFGAFNVSGQGTGYLCGNLTYVHDPYFAGNMVLWARDEAKRRGEAATDDGAFDALALAKGFVVHILGDLVGFSTSGGVLCTAEAGTVACADADALQYIPEWGYMSAIDAWVFRAYNLSRVYTSLPLPGPKTLPAAAYNFLASSSERYHAMAGSFAPFSDTAAEQCAIFWQDNMQYVYDRAMLYAEDTDNSAFLDRELQWFAPSYVPEGKFDAYMQAQTRCAVQVIRAYFDLLLEKEVGSAAAFNEVAMLAQKLYDDGQCV